MTVETKDIDFTADDFTFAQQGEKLIDKNYKASSYAKDVWANFRKNKGAVFGAVVIIVIIIMAIIGPMISGHTYKSIIIQHADLPPRIPGLEKLGIFNGDELIIETGGGTQCGVDTKIGGTACDDETANTQ